MKRSPHGKVASAERCAPLEGIRVHRFDPAGREVEATVSGPGGQWHLAWCEPGDTVVFSGEGFVSKRYADAALPDLVRLLEDRLTGYQRRLWFRPGELVEAYIHAPGPFNCTLYRHGHCREAVLDLGTHQRKEQRVPDGLFVDHGLDWESSLRYRIPEDAAPGLYSLLLSGEGQAPFAVPFVVSTPADRQGKTTGLLVLASTNTWQSYNLWGGRSRYRNAEDRMAHEFIDLPPGWVGSIKGLAGRFLPEPVRRLIRKALGRPAGEPAWFFKRLSIMRPFAGCQLEEDDPLRPFTNHLAGAEWRLLAWLEREGYDYDILSGYEFHRDPGAAERYQCVILNTHSEYWTRDMYEALKAFHEQRGGWILNLSGNSIYREIVFSDDGSSRCVSTSFRDSCDDETQLLGVRFTPSDYSTCAPYEVLEPDHWAFSGVPQAKGASFGRLSLNRNTGGQGNRYDPGRPGLEHGLAGEGASGWETDKLSGSAPRDIMLVAKGLNRRGGADMVVRDPCGTRGGMFSASSIVFSGSLLIDEACGAIVKNVLRRALE